VPLQETILDTRSQWGKRAFLGRPECWYLLSVNLVNVIRWRRDAFVVVLGAAAVVAHAQSAQPNQAPSVSGQDNPPATKQEPAKPSLLTPLKPQVATAPYRPITARQRVRWFIADTIGPPHLLGGAVTTALGTAMDRPKEYGTGWDGFGKRYGIRLSGISVGNAMEASIGSLWGEDPRYFAMPETPFRARLRNIVRQTFVARRRDGNYRLACARFVAIPGNNFLSNPWRADSEANVHDAVLRTGEGFAGRMAANAFEEFWPSVKGHIFHKKQ